MNERKTHAMYDPQMAAKANITTQLSAFFIRQAPEN